MIRWEVSEGKWLWVYFGKAEKVGFRAGFANGGGWRKLWTHTFDEGEHKTKRTFFFAFNELYEKEKDQYAYELFLGPLAIHFFSIKD